VVPDDHGATRARRRGAGRPSTPLL
jgi:hypothetical protein